MSLLAHLTRKRPPEAASAPLSECPHWELGPRWDSVDDIGHTDRITHYNCTTCGKTLSRAEADARAAS